jgi:hypothetical protein
MSMSVPPKTPVAYARAGRKLADPLTSTSQSRDGKDRQLRLEVRGLFVSKLSRAKIIPISEQKIYVKEEMELTEQPRKMQNGEWSAAKVQRLCWLLLLANQKERT